jgi:hypothetical protein
MTADLEAWLDANARAMRTQLFGSAGAQRPVATGGGGATGAQRPATGGGGALAEWTGGIIGGRQAGGYTQDGLYRLHGGEFVMNRGTAGRAEGLLGGTLSQGNIVNALTTKKLAISLDINAPNLSGPARAQMEASMIQTAQSEAKKVFREVMVEVGKSRRL